MSDLKGSDSMAYPVNKIADYVVEYAKKINKPVNNLKLQKILYYLQALFLLEKEAPLFNESIEKWQYGPVIPEVYHRFKHMGAEEITKIPAEFNFFLLLDKDFDLEEINKPKLDFTLGDNDIHLVNKCIESLVHYEPFQLVDETHKHPAWSSNQKRILQGERNIRYTNDEILRDFRENKEFRLWTV